MCAKTQLYARKSEPGVEQAIEKAKAQFERRRCGHHPDTYAEPLSAHECVLSVVDPKGSGAGNKHRYVCAINDDGLRASLRQVPGVPLIFIRRSVVLMEPMAHATARVRSAEERGKFRAEIKRPGGQKRKRDEDEESAGTGEGRSGNRGPDATTLKSDDKKRRKPRGPKEPNPLSVKKKKKSAHQPESTSKTENHNNNNKRKEEETATAIGTNDAAADQPKKKRKRKHKSGSSSGGGEEAATTPAHGGGGEGAPAITVLET